MFYVYLIRSLNGSNEKYVGFTSNLKARLQAHNNGNSPYTSKFKPWSLITYIAFSDRTKAMQFEKYLKSHTGRTFAEKRLWH